MTGPLLLLMVGSAMVVASLFVLQSGDYEVGVAMEAVGFIIIAIWVYGP